MREYTATPIENFQDLSLRVVIQADDMNCCDGSDVVAFMLNIENGIYIKTKAIASVPGDKYIIMSKEL